MTKQSPSVYIAYCRTSEADTELAKQLASYLRNEGVETFLDVLEMQPGMEIFKLYDDAITAANTILLLATEGLKQQDYANLEEKTDDPFWGVLAEREDLEHKRLIPILFPSITLNDLPYSFADRVGVHLASSDGASEFRSILEAVMGRKDPTELRSGSAIWPLRPSLAPVRLRRLVVKDFRRFDHLVLAREEETVAAHPSTGQWTLVLGDNGAGKTSLLWAIGMGLLERPLVDGIAASVSSRFIRHHRRQSRVVIREGDSNYLLDLVDLRGKERTEGASASPDFMVFGYGCGRGSAFGGPQRSVDLDRPLDAVNTLYGIKTSLIHAETWLQNLEHSALKAKDDDSAAILFQNVCNVLTSVLPEIEEVQVDADRVVFVGPAVGQCPTDSLSDGYATTLGWIVDMMARWIHEQQRLERPIPQNFNQHMTGLVLIDELDLHLHPRWQMRIVEDVRAAFPKMSFVATTHNPLTLLGAEPGEIHVLDSCDQEMAVRQVDLPAGIRTDQVLTGVWFGLSSTLDKETQTLLDEHRQLLRDGTAQTDPGRKELEHQLRLRLGSFADTTEDRMAQEIVAQELATREFGKSASPLTQFELQTVRDKVQKALAPKQ